MSEHTTNKPNNSAERSTVGIQADQVHDSNVYFIGPDDLPERVYEVGVAYLNNGVPLRARERINSAIARGHENAQVWFHWALAMLSMRSYRELTRDERTQLAQLPHHLGRFPHDEWTHALAVLCELLAHLDSPERDPAAALRKFQALPTGQRRQIRYHWDLVLTGGLKDRLWAEVRREAHRYQRAGGRADRVWAYFEPAPIRARTRPPAPNSATAVDWLRAVAMTGLFAGGVGYLGWTLLLAPTSVAVVAYLLMVTGGAVAAGTGFEWRYKTHRIRAKDLEYLDSNTVQEAQVDGFERRVSNRFQHYAYKFGPSGEKHASWLSETRRARAALCDEVAEIYGGSRIAIRKVDWLVRFLVRDVRRQWRQHVLLDYRDQYRTSSMTRFWCVSGSAIGSLCACVVVESALRTDLFVALVGGLVVAIAGWDSSRRWWHVLSERRRCAEEEHERDCVQQAREAEYRRWKDKLMETRPAEEEMEAWMRYDKTVLVDDALRHYRLAWSDITAYAIVQTAAEGCQRARVQGGAWRYSKYDLRLFLITHEGVRETARRLDVKQGTFDNYERGHFRFDAVSSLRVVESGNCDYTLELTLSNGPSRIIDVTQPTSDGDPARVDDPGLARISLDSTGFTHALHVLEGIAAEGKTWIHHQAA